MSFYIIEDDDGYVLTNECYFDNTMVYARLYDEPSEPEHDVEEFGGHVVTLIEEPEKVVISKEQAQVVKEAHEYRWPAKYITDHCDNSNGLEELLMKAYVNGYTLAKEKKYNVKVPHIKDVWYYKVDDNYCYAASSLGACLSDDRFLFTDADIERYGLQDCEKEEVK